MPTYTPQNNTSILCYVQDGYDAMLPLVEHHHGINDTIDYSQMVTCTHTLKLYLGTI